MLIERTESTLDTVPNRFVRFVLERWRALAQTVAHHAGALSGAAMRRGIQEAERTVAKLDEYLGNPLFRQVGRLTIYPGDNQVLRRREGYRQFASAAALVEGTLGLELDLEDPFLVSRRSIATLYEYWTFVRLAQAAARACGKPGMEGQLFEASSHGMSLVLRANASTRLKFSTEVGDEPVLVDLFFNREFRRDSWTRPMRPDASLVVRKVGQPEVWLHFDAKYRVDWSSPFQTGAIDEEEDAERTGVSKRTDLLKMHAYRDAIKDSAGSYVLFPGSEVAGFSVNGFEFLPGLGAFPLRPDHADSDGVALQAFLSRVIAHVAAAGTRHRRAMYWTAKAYEGAGTATANTAPPAGDLPPADTRVLIGYVRSNKQWNWVRGQLLYNVRSGSRPGAVALGGPELDAPIVVLYGLDRGTPSFELYRRTGNWEGITGSTIRHLGYPNPRGDAYLLTQLEPLPLPVWLSTISVNRLRPPGCGFGKPFSTSWLDLVLSTQRAL
jgi:hypothetical protein